MLNQDDVIYFVLTDRFCNGDPTNGREPMPLPASISIAVNGNIPPRIKALLADGVVLRGESAELPDLKVYSGGVEIQLPRKMTGIYTLNGCE